jgi:hypothetical protein
MSSCDHPGARRCQGRVSFTKSENGAGKFVLYERYLCDGALVEEVWERGICEVRWEHNKKPSAQELEAARWLFFAGPRADPEVRLEELRYTMFHVDAAVVTDWQLAGAGAKEESQQCQPTP